MMPMCLAPSSVQQKFQFFLPIGIAVIGDCEGVSGVIEVGVYQLTVKLLVQEPSTRDEVLL